MSKNDIFTCYLLLTESQRTILNYILKEEAT